VDDYFLEELDFVGSFSYDEKEDALRVTAKPQAADFREALTYTFEEVKPDSAAATCAGRSWRFPSTFSVDVKAVVLKSVKNELRSVGGFSWAGFDEAAQWCLDNNYNLEEALKWEDTSIQNEERFENLETKSRILDGDGTKRRIRQSAFQGVSIKPARFNSTPTLAACNDRATPSEHLNCFPRFRRKTRIIGSATWRWHGSRRTRVTSRPPPRK